MKFLAPFLLAATSSAFSFHHPKSDASSSNIDAARLSRREFGFKVIGTAGACTVPLLSEPAFAKASQEDVDKGNLLKGYERLTYFLDNWEKETTVCGRSDNPYQGLCERNPYKVMEYLGFKSTQDPLFKADKTMRRLESLVPSDREGEFLEAVDKWMEAADEANGMAFISSWGEANPGGGKDRIELFIERSKKNVLDARSSLATIIDILDLNKS